MLTGIFIIFLFLLFIGLNECVKSGENCEDLKDTVHYDNCHVKLTSDDANFEISCYTNRTYSNDRWGGNVRKMLMTLKFRTTTQLTDFRQNASIINCIKLISITFKGLPPNKLDNRNLSNKAEYLDIARAFFSPRVEQTYVDYSEVNSFKFEFRFLSNSSVGSISYNHSCVFNFNNNHNNNLILKKCVSEIKAFEFNAHPIKIFQYPESTYVSHIFNFTNINLIMSFNSSIHSYAIQLFVFTVEKIGLSILSGLKIRELSLAFNKIETISQGVIPEIPSLKALHLNNVNLEFIMDNAFKSLPNLEHLNLAGNNLLTNLTDAGLPNLKTLVLSQCPKTPEIIFRYNFPQLNTLDLSDNNLENGVKFTTIFELFPNLRTLILDKNNIDLLLDFNLPINRNQTYTVSFRDNNINSWNETKLSLSRNTHFNLDLSKNNISIVSPKMLDEFSSIKSVILDNNPFDCRQCVVDPFVNWLQKYNSDASYKCWFPEEARNKMIIDLHIDADLCTEKIFNWLINVYTPLIVLAVISITLTALVIKYRWYLRYFYHLFHARLMAKKRKLAVEDEISHQFDAFVSYSSMESNWVVEQLIPRVELEEPALHLCIHDRDFLAGGVIMENIIECIDISRKSIFLISKSFIRSNWCKWELQMAQHKLFDDGNDVLILILLEELNINEIPKTLKRLMSTRTYLTWPDPLNIPACKLFWSRLKHAIGQCHCMQAQNQLILIEDE